MKKTFLAIFCLFVSVVSGQEEDAWVYFKDKPNSATYLSNPLTMLTQRSIDRRTKQGISLVITDVPLESTYVSTVAASTGITVKSRSKWLNAVHVRGTQSNIDALESLMSVDSIQYANKSLNKSSSKRNKKYTKFGKLKEATTIDYGQAANQINILKGEFLHNLGYTGNAIHIAVIDAGFKGVETFAAFATLRDNNAANGEILGGYDFVNRNTDFYANTGSTHGLSVLSTMAGYIENQFVGTAPHAQYYLYVSEDAPNENPLEESLWVEAAERADSLGVDVINTSLGYSTFDNAAYDYSYADMDGNTTFITRGAEIGASKGIIMVNSAGNSGASPWKYITAPADAASVLTVGAVDASENIASFSSFGPTSDNRIKPDVLAQGHNAYVINGAGSITQSSGTSFSGPIMAGVVACLWESAPMKTASEIRQLIVESADLFENPTAQRGYGVPDFQMTYNNTLSLDKKTFQKGVIYPTLVENTVRIKFPSNIGGTKLTIKNILGKSVFEKDNVIPEQPIDVSKLTSGMYFAVLEFNTEKKVFKLIKK